MGYGVDIPFVNSGVQGRMVTIGLLCHMPALEGNSVLAFIDGVGAVLDIWGS